MFSLRLDTSWHFWEISPILRRHREVLELCFLPSVAIGEPFIGEKTKHAQVHGSTEPAPTTIKLVNPDVDAALPSRASLRVEQP